MNFKRGIGGMFPLSMSEVLEKRYSLVEVAHGSRMEDGKSSSRPSRGYTANFVIVLKLEGESCIGSIVGSRADATDVYKNDYDICVPKMHKSYVIMLKYLNV
jgi:hypothetical protein